MRKALMLHGVRLSPRQWQIAEALADSLTGKEIAARLGLRHSTVKAYMEACYRRMESVHPEVKEQDARLVLAAWMRCELCKLRAIPYENTMESERAMMIEGPKFSERKPCV